MESRIIKPGNVLLDQKGNPIPDASERAYAAEELKNFMEKNKKQFEEYWKIHGFGAKPPIIFNTNTKKWEWRE